MTSYRNRTLCTLCGSLVVVCSTMASGSESPVTHEVDTLPKIIVHAARPVARIGGSAAVEMDVDSLPLPAAPTVEELSRALPHLHVRTNSRGEAEISARGSESRQVAVLVDGVPITLAWDARADLSAIPANAVRDVTFTRGLSSMLYGPNVLGGIVEIGIARNSYQPDRQTARISIGADDNGSLGSAISTAVPLTSSSGEWLFRGGLGYRDSPGDPRAHGVDEPVPTDNDLRLNTDFRNVDAFAALRYRSTKGHWFSASGIEAYRERGIAAELGLADDDARLWRYPDIANIISALSAGTGPRHSPLGGQVSFESTIGYSRVRTDINSYATRAYDEVVGFENGRGRTATLRMLANHSLGSRGQLSFALTGADIGHRELIPAGEFEYQQRLASIGVESAWIVRVSNGVIRRLSVTAGAAYDRASTPKSGGRDSQDPLSELGARFGMTAVVGDNEQTTVHAGISRRGRFPALRELYSGALNRFVVNPELEPEKLLTIEAGQTTRLPKGELQTVLFHSLLKDAIVRVTLDDGTNRFQRVNRNELRSTGIELQGIYRTGHLELTCDATWQSVDLTDTDAARTNRPENLPELFGGGAARFPIIVGLIGDVHVRHTGEQFGIDGSTGNDVALDPQTIVNVALLRRWKLPVSWFGGVLSGAEARAALENVADAALYDAVGLPRPGRRLRVEFVLN